MKKFCLTFAILLIAFCLPSFGQASPGFTKLTEVTSGTTYTDPTVSDQLTYYYEVTTVDTMGHESGPGICGTSQLCFATSQAVALMPSSGTHTVALSWNASTSTNVAGYNVYRATGPLAPSALAAIVQ